MNNKHKHLTLEDRSIIEKDLILGKSRRSIALKLDKDPSTICKEVKVHRLIVKKTAYHGKGVRDCINMDTCPACINRYCDKICSKYKMELCTRRDRTVGVCNGCDKYRSCRKTKYKYDAITADKKYRNILVSSREGSDLLYSEAKELAETIREPLKNGQSVYVILNNHPEIKQCTKTIYNYIENGTLQEFNITMFDHRRKLKMKARKTNVLKKRKDMKYLNGRNFNDFISYSKDNTEASIVEMDTVYNDISNGPFIQTFYIRKLKLLYGILHEKLTSQDMLDGITLMKKWLGNDLFKELFQIILTDRGTEFVRADEIENLGSKIFYCDPMASYQKTQRENAHGPLRFILPKADEVKDLYSIGLRTQKDLNLVLSHFNSYQTKKLNGKSRFEYMDFAYSKYLTALLDKLNLEVIEKDKVIMDPKLLNMKK